MTDPRIGKNGVIIFDGSCGACSTFIGEKRSFFERHEFTVVPLQEHWVSEATGLDEVELSQAIHLVTPAGDVYRGIDFFQYLAEKIWWMTPLSMLLRIRWLKPLWRKLYDFIANRRVKISKICGLQSKAIYR